MFYSLVRGNDGAYSFGTMGTRAPCSGSGTHEEGVIMFISQQCTGRTNLAFLDASIEAMSECLDVCADFLKMYQGR